MAGLPRDVSVAAVNSALQRARATLGERAERHADARATVADAGTKALLERFVDAFERYDMDALSRLLHEDATLSMPPVLAVAGTVTRRSAPGWSGPARPAGARGSCPRSASASLAFGQYRPDPDGGGRLPWALIVLEVGEGRVIGLNPFLDTASLFPRFGLPPRLDRAQRRSELNRPGTGTS